ncbi:Sua5/YciO/YrdC/YwlC family protein, partial [Candidatus Dependentiae bacterium]|nr:Sua5/YciO/YrdC/YwlC family protein [Candidatus Dependentiae bacterium]
VIFPLASTSANTSGETEISDFETAYKKFHNKVDAIIKYSENINKLNTMVEFDDSGEYRILREGKYNSFEIAKLLDE